jgi:hypothetical protein
MGYDLIHENINLAYGDEDLTHVEGGSPPFLYGRRDKLI